LRYWDYSRQFSVENKESGWQMHFPNPAKVETGIHIDKAVARLRIGRFSYRATEYPKWLNPIFILFSRERPAWESLGQLLDLRFGTEYRDIQPL